MAHNPAGARSLAIHLATLPTTGTRRTVLGILGDKDAGAMIEALIPETDVWYLTDLPGPRGGSAEALATQLRALHPDAALRLHGHAEQALAQALADGLPGDRVVVTGSFLTVALAAPAPL